MKIVICWSHISGYMAACWRELARVPNVDVFLIAFQSDSSAPFDASLLDGIRYRLLNADEQKDVGLVGQLVRSERPDILLTSGWNNAAYRPLTIDRDLATAKKLLCMDTPFRNDWRQWFGRLKLRSYLRRFDRIIVPGERARTYAKFLGFEDRQIRRGLYGIDYNAFAPILERRKQRPGGWPKRFLYVGRYAPEKGIDVLVDAYCQYRASTADPWELACAGTGPERIRLAGQPGVVDLGFVQPADLASVFESAGALVLASRYDPWGVVVVEACAAGLPVIASDACGSTVELLRDGFNGYNVATGDAAMLASRLLRLSTVEQRTWGARSQQNAAAYAAGLWPRRVFDDYL